MWTSTALYVHLTGQGFDGIQVYELARHVPVRTILILSTEEVGQPT